MGRGTLWAATAGPEPSAADIERIATELNLSIPADAAPSVLFRALRTLLNLTQKEFGVLIAPGGSNPISASVICQLETGLQPLPALLITCAATAATAVQRFGNWRRAEHAGCHDSALSALRALNAGCEAEIESFVAAQAELPDIERELVGTYLAVVSKRKSSGLTDRPATRAPYKKGAKKGEGKEEGSEGKEKKECAARGPRGSYKVKKRLPQAVALSSADSSDGASTPTHSSEGSSVCSSELSAATTCPNSPADGGSDGGCDLPDMRIGLDELRLFDACDDTSCDGAGGGCNGGAGADEGGVQLL